MNALIRHLADVCRAHRLDEKWLIAPSRRIAHQWLDQVTRAGVPVVNVRVQTTRTVALELLRPALATGEIRLVTPAARRLAVAEAWHQAMQADGYLGQARLTPRLLALAEGTLGDLRMASLGPQALSADRFEEAQKGRELKALLGAYQAQLKRLHLIDHADAMRLAVASLGERVPDVLLILPTDLDRSLTVLERAPMDTVDEAGWKLTGDGPGSDLATPAFDTEETARLRLENQRLRDELDSVRRRLDQDSEGA